MPFLTSCSTDVILAWPAPIINKPIPYKSFECISPTASVSLVEPSGYTAFQRLIVTLNCQPPPQKKTPKNQQTKNPFNYQEIIYSQLP